MNRAQKNAWFGLINCLLAIAFYVFLVLSQTMILPYPPVRAFSFQPQPSQLDLILRGWPLVLPVIALILLLVPRKKQSHVEPDTDELDIVIQNKATRAAFISVWLVWLLAIILLILTQGAYRGMVSVIECIYIHLGVFLVCMTTYFLTKVLLYHRQTQGGAA